jgi:hypothetical protein
MDFRKIFTYISNKSVTIKKEHLIILSRSARIKISFSFGLVLFEAKGIGRM